MNDLAVHIGDEIITSESHTLELQASDDWTLIKKYHPYYTFENPFSGIIEVVTDTKIPMKKGDKCKIDFEL